MNKFAPLNAVQYCVTDVTANQIINQIQ